MGKELGERILNLLKEKGLTQKNFAELLGVTEAGISRYISGERDPKLGMLTNIASALDTTPNFLLGIEDEEEWFDFPRIKTLIARNAKEMSRQEKADLISVLFEEA